MPRPSPSPLTSSSGCPRGLDALRILCLPWEQHGSEKLGSGVCEKMDHNLILFICKNFGEAFPSWFLSLPCYMFEAQMYLG